MNIHARIQNYNKNKYLFSFSNVLSLIFFPITIYLYIDFLNNLSIINIFSFTTSFILLLFCFCIKYKSNKNMKIIEKKLQKELRIYDGEILMKNVRKMLDQQSSEFANLNDGRYYRINDGILTIYKNEERNLLRVI